MARRDLHLYHIYMRYLRLVHGACVLFHHLSSSKVPYCRVRQAAFVEVPVARQFHVSKEVAILGVSLFVLGLGLGPLVAGPLSELYGRNIIYRVSFALFFLCMFPVAFAPDICMCLFLMCSVSAP
jgi:hypothetical protein